MKATKQQQDKRLRAWFSAARRKYGVTEEQIREQWAAQGGACAICLRPFKTALPSIDHDHVTGFVRGLLCGGSYDAKTCNRLIGFHSAKTLRRAAEYLERPPAYGVIGQVRPGTTEQEVEAA